MPFLRKVLPLAVALLFSNCVANRKTNYQNFKKGLYIGKPIPIDSFNKYYKPFIDSLGGKY